MCGSGKKGRASSGGKAKARPKVEEQAEEEAVVEEGVSMKHVKGLGKGVTRLAGCVERLCTALEGQQVRAAFWKDRYVRGQQVHIGRGGGGEGQQFTGERTKVASTESDPQFTGDHRVGVQAFKWMRPFLSNTSFPMCVVL